MSVDPAFRRFVPPDTKALGEVRLEKLRATPFYQRHEQQFNFPQLDEFAERTSVDPRRDISDVLMAWNGEQALALARGHFRESDIEQKLRSMGARTVKYRDRKLFSTSDQSIAFVRKDVIAGARTQELRSLIDLAESGAGRVPADLERRMALLSRSDQIWEVSEGQLPFANLPLRSDIQSALSNIVGFVNGTSIGIAFDTGIRFEGDLTCISNEGAKRVSDAVRGSIGLARLMTKDNELDLLRLWDSVHVSQDQRDVHVRADLEPGLADRIFDQLSHLRGRAGELLERR